jgi:hypothetical protein
MSKLSFPYYGMSDYRKSRQSTHKGATAAAPFLYTEKMNLIESGARIILAGTVLSLPCCVVARRVRPLPTKDTVPFRPHMQTQSARRSF